MRDAGCGAMRLRHMHQTPTRTPIVQPLQPRKKTISAADSTSIRLTPNTAPAWPPWSSNLRSWACRLVPFRLRAFVHSRVGAFAHSCVPAFPPFLPACLLPFARWSFPPFLLPCLPPLPVCPAMLTAGCSEPSADPHQLSLECLIIRQRECATLQRFRHPLRTAAPKPQLDIRGQ